MSEEEIKTTTEETTGGADKAGAEKSTAETLIERSDKLSEDNTKLRAELDEVKMKLATQKVGGITTAGSQEKKEESPKEYRERVNKEMAAGKTEW